MTVNDHVEILLAKLPDNVGAVRGDKLKAEVRSWRSLPLLSDNRPPTSSDWHRHQTTEGFSADSDLHSLHSRS